MCGKGRRVKLTQVWTVLLWVITCFHESHTVKIVKIVVPPIVQYGVQDTVILDCEYTLGNDTNGLVVKWFFKNKSRLVYQWIATQKPQDIGVLRGKVDLTYKATNEPLKMHRALRVTKISTELSGDYTCVVSTFMEEDSRTKQMIVFAPETSFKLIQNKTDDDTVNVICAADGAFPAPNLTLATPDRRLEGVSHTVKLVDGRYSAYASVTLQDADLPSPAEFICTLRIPLANYAGVSLNVKLVDGRYSAYASVTLQDADLPSPAEFICTLRIPLANYAVRKEAIYYPGPISTTPEMATASDMRLTAAVGSRGANTYTTITVCILAVAAQLIINIF